MSGSAEAPLLHWLNSICRDRSCLQWQMASWMWHQSNLAVHFYEPKSRRTVAVLQPCHYL